MKKFLSFFAFAALAMTMVACSDDNSDGTVEPGDNDKPGQEVTLKTGEYNYVSAEYVDENNNVVAMEYDTFTVTKNMDGSYTVSDLMYSSVQWNATFDKKNSQLILDGTGTIETEQGPDDNNGETFFFIATDLLQVSETEYAATAMLSFESIESFNDPNGDGTVPCILNVNPQTGLIESFETLLVSVAYLFDPQTGELGDCLGLVAYAIPGENEILEGAAEQDYVELSKGGPRTLKLAR